MVEPVRQLGPLILLLACASRAPAQAPTSNEPPGETMASDTELQRRLDDLSDEHVERFGPAITWLAAHADQARASLLALAGSEGGLTRARALEALGRAGDPVDVPALAAALEGSTGTAAWDAAKALGVHPAPEATAALIAATRAPSADVAGAAATLLGQRGAEEGRSALEALLARPEAGVRYRAVRALGALGAEGSAEALSARAAVEQDADVQAALTALGHPGR